MGCSSSRAAALPAVDDPSLFAPTAKDESTDANASVNTLVPNAEANELDLADALKNATPHACAPRDNHPSSEDALHHRPHSAGAMTAPRARMSSRQTFGFLQ